MKLKITVSTDEAAVAEIDQAAMFPGRLIMRLPLS